MLAKFKYSLRFVLTVKLKMYLQLDGIIYVGIHAIERVESNKPI
jgi:hypothetical protein